MKKRIFLIVAIISIGQFLCDKNPLFLDESYYAGVIPIKNNQSDIFYWLFESKKSPKTDPLVIWLDGGPGYSSMEGLFAENGPFTIRDDSKELTLESNPNSWNRVANVVYVDQPIGTGFSKVGKSKYAETLDEVAKDFIEFLLQFYEKFSEYKNRPLFLTGESFAGHYIPVIAKEIISFEKKSIINLVGIAIGNASVDASNQYSTYYSYAKENNLIKKESENEDLQNGFDSCKKDIKLNENTYPIESCDIALLNLIKVKIDRKFSPFNIQKICDMDRDLIDSVMDPDNDPICGGDEQKIERFLNQEKVLNLLNIEDNRTFEISSENVYQNLFRRDLVNNSPQVAYLLDHGIRMLFYYGDLDFLLNWMGGEKWTNEIAWGKQDQFMKKHMDPWKEYGKIKTFENLTFLRIFRAGHAVPRDQPEASLEMITDFINGKNLG